MGSVYRCRMKETIFSLIPPFIFPRLFFFHWAEWRRCFVVVLRWRRLSARMWEAFSFRDKTSHFAVFHFFLCFDFSSTFLSYFCSCWFIKLFCSASWALLVYKMNAVRTGKKKIMQWKYRHLKILYFVYHWWRVRIVKLERIQ